MLESAAGKPLLAQVLVCFAVPQEARHFRVSMKGGANCPVVITGIGQHNARTALEAALTRFQPRIVLTCGFAGALHPDLSVGTVIFSGDNPEVTARLLELGARQASFHCASRIASTAAEKAELWRTTGADAVEMESGAIQEFCRARGIASVTIRVISDGARQDLPLDFNLLMNEHQDLDYRKLAKALLRSPNRLPGLIHFGRETNRAARNLGCLLTELLRGNHRTSG